MAVDEWRLYLINGARRGAFAGAARMGQSRPVGDVSMAVEIVRRKPDSTARQCSVE